jgi:hypothetical protein
VIIPTPRRSLVKMVDVFRDFIDFCQEPPPPFAGDTHIIGFNMLPSPAPEDVFQYHGFAVLRPTGVSSHPFVLEGIGASNPVANHLTPHDFPPMVKIGVQIGRHNPIEAVLQFGGVSVKGGFGTILRDERVDAAASPGHLGAVSMTFDNGSFKRHVKLFKTNLLRTL